MVIGSLAGERSLSKLSEVMGAAPRVLKRSRGLCSVAPAPAYEELKCRVRNEGASISEFVFNSA